MTLRNKIEIPLACLSLANLFFMPAWMDFAIADLNLAPNMNIRLYSLVTIVEMLMLGSGLYLCYFLLNRLAVWPLILRGLFLFSLILAIPATLALYHLLPPNSNVHISFSGRVFMLGLILASVAVISFCCYFRKETLKAACNIGKVCLLLAAPLLIVSGYSLGKGLLFPYTLVDCVSPESPVSRDQTRRVVLFIFDELDYKWAVENRPSSVVMPVFDRFRNVSWEAVEAYPPGGGTLFSIPSYLTGKITRETRFNTPFDFDVLDDKTGDWIPLNNPDNNLIGRLKQKGIPSGIVGFYFPYGRLLGSQLTTCKWEAFSKLFWLPNIPAWTFPIFKSYPFALRLSFIHAKERLVFRARQAMGRKDIGFLFIHLPFPHLPTQYDPRTGYQSHLIIDKNPFSSYQKNLCRMDQILESLLNDLDSSGAATNTTLILTSDHWFRVDPSPGFRIPFIVHFPGQTNEVRFNEAFNTVTLYNLIPDLFSGAVTNGEQLSIWMQTNAFRKSVDYKRFIKKRKRE